MSFKRIAVIGAGAVGAYYGGRLAEHGHDVSFFTRSDFAALRERGLRVKSVHGDFTLANPNVYDDTAAMPSADLVIVSLKATAKADYVRLVRPVVHDQSVIVCLQNGLGNEDVFADAFGNHRVFGGIAYTCINRIGPGDISHTAHGRVRVGAFRESPFPVAQQIADMMKAANIIAEAVEDLKWFRWQKLLWNIPFNGWGAALDLHSAAILRNAGGEQLIRDTMAEVQRAAAAVGVTLDQSLVDANIKQTREMGDYHSSMQLDRQAGRAMEIDAVIAEPLRQARAAGEGELPLISTMQRCLEAL
ncbi:MAG: 2-dehydropantoate 2-reductase [Tepidisphaeraceae bacterium]